MEQKPIERKIKTPKQTFKNELLKNASNYAGVDLSNIVISYGNIDGEAETTLGKLQGHHIQIRNKKDTFVLAHELGHVIMKQKKVTQNNKEQAANEIANDIVTHTYKTPLHPLRKPTFDNSEEFFNVQLELARNANQELIVNRIGYFDDRPTTRLFDASNRPTQGNHTISYKILLEYQKYQTLQHSVLEIANFYQRLFAELTQDVMMQWDQITSSLVEDYRRPSTYHLIPANENLFKPIVIPGYPTIDPSLMIPEEQREEKKQKAYNAEVAYMKALAILSKHTAIQKSFVPTPAITSPAQLFSDALTYMNSIQMVSNRRKIDISDNDNERYRLCLNTIAQGIKNCTELLSGTNHNESKQKTLLIHIICNYNNAYALSPYATVVDGRQPQGHGELAALRSLHLAPDNQPIDIINLRHGIDMNAVQAVHPTLDLPKYNSIAGIDTSTHGAMQNLTNRIPVLANANILTARYLTMLSEMKYPGQQTVMHFNFPDMANFPEFMLPVQYKTAFCEAIHEKTRLINTEDYSNVYDLIEVIKYEVNKFEPYFESARIVVPLNWSPTFWREFETMKGLVTNITNYTPVFGDRKTAWENFMVETEQLLQAIF